MPVLLDDLMPWARLEDNYFTNGKVAGNDEFPGLSKDAKLLDLAGIAFSARELRDGRLRAMDVRVVAAQVDVDNLGKCLKELVEAHRWAPIDGGWEIHDYLFYNPTREKVLKDREDARLRMQELRDGKKPRPRSSERSAERSGERTGERSDEVTVNVRGNLIDPGPGPVNVPIPGSADPAGSAAGAPAHTREGESPTTKTKPKTKRTRLTVADEAFQAKLVAEFTSVYGNQDRVMTLMRTALGYGPFVNGKYTDEQAFLRGWLQRDAPQHPPVGTRTSGVVHSNHEAISAAAKQLDDMPIYSASRQSETDMGAAF